MLFAAAHSDACTAALSLQACNIGLHLYNQNSALQGDRALCGSVWFIQQVMCCAQLDIAALYRREGDAPVRALQAALAAFAEPGAGANGTSTEPAEGAPPADAAALRSALGGLVWTPSLRRMYTLLDRCRCGTVSSMHGHEHTLLHAIDALGGLVWTPSLRRMYTLLDRCGYGTVSSMHGNEHTFLHAANALGSPVWTPSVRRMYTLLDRCRPAVCLERRVLEKAHMA